MALCNAPPLNEHRQQLGQESKIQISSIYNTSYYINDQEMKDHYVFKAGEQ